MAAGYGALQTNICTSYIKVACSRVGEKCSPTGRKPGVGGKFKPFRIERRSKSFAGRGR